MPDVPQPKSVILNSQTVPFAKCYMGRAESNPYDPPSSLSEPNQKGLLCPYCEHTYRLTWARYVAEPIRGYRCPNCDRKAKLQRPGGYFTRIVSWTTLEVLAGFAMAIGSYFVIGWYGLVVGGMAAFVFMLEEDRRYDESRTLTRIE